MLRRSASPPLRRSAVVTPVAGGPSAPDPVVPAAAAAAPAFLADGDTVGAMAGEVVELRGAA